jgi:hypothetical protein
MVRDGRRADRRSVHHGSEGLETLRRLTMKSLRRRSSRFWILIVNGRETTRWKLTVNAGMVGTHVPDANDSCANGFHFP